MSRAAIAFVIVAAGAAGVLGQAAGPAPAGSRTVVVISDLHMGEGRTAAGEWRPQEDFRWTPEFATFLQAIDVEGRGSVDLILNGDTFELLESTGACAAAAVGCSEPEMSGRLERVLAAHQADIVALGRFAAAGSNRVVVVPGDHDAALLFPSLRRRVIEAIAAPSGRIEVSSSGTWASSDSRVVVEHGHQLGVSARKLANWPAPFVRHDGHELLVPSPGELATQGIYNRLEERYPIVDNLAVQEAGLKYALPAAGLAAEAAPLLRAILLATPWQQFRMELDDGEVEPPVWDIPLVRKQGAAFFVAAVPDDDPFKSLVASAAASGSLASTLDQWSDEEIGVVCDYRAAVRRARRRFEPQVTQFAPRGPAVAECPRTPGTRGAQFDYFWRSRDELFGRELKRAAGQAAKNRRAIEVLVHSHTHLPDRSQNNANMISGGLLKIPMEGFSPARGAVSPIVINSGAWQRTITPVQYERLRATRSMSDDALLGSLRPEDLTPCYSFVRIPPYADAPSPVVRYWRQAGSEWRIADACGG